MRDDLVDIDQNEDFEEKKNNWQDLIDETGVGDKMQQYAELQEQGSDIQMSTFSMLKNYPFLQRLVIGFCHFYPTFFCKSIIFKRCRWNTRFCFFIG